MKNHDIGKTGGPKFKKIWNFIKLTRPVNLAKLEQNPFLTVGSLHISYVERLSKMSLKLKIKGIKEFEIAFQQLSNTENYFYIHFSLIRRFVLTYSWYFIQKKSKNLDFENFWKNSRKRSKIIFSIFLQKIMQNGYLGFVIPSLVSIFVTTHNTLLPTYRFFKKHYF
jgi:hypothetical protein